MEKELKFKVGKVATAAKEGSYSSCFEVAPQDSEEASRGSLLAVVAISASEKFDADGASHKVLSALKDNFYSQKTGGILVALEHAVTAAHQRLLTIVFSGGDESAVDFDLVAGVLWGSVFYLAQLGNGKAVIRRGGKLRLIGHRKEVSEELSASDRPEVRTASGLLEEGDVLALGSPRFFEVVGTDELEKLLGHESVRQMTTDLKIKVGDEPMAAGVVLAIGEREEPEVTESEKEKEHEEEAKEHKKEELEHKEEPAALAAAAWGGGAQLQQVKSRLGELLGKTRKKFGPVGERAGEQAASLRKRYGRKEYLGVAVERGKQVWDKLGRPRTALEGVEQARNRRTLLALAVLLLVILMIGVLVNNMFKGGSGKDRGRFDNLVSTAQGQYDEAQQASATDKSRAEQLLSSASDNLKEALGMHFDDTKVVNLQGKITALRDSLEGVTTVSPSTLVDLTQLRPGAQGTAMAGNATSLYVLDGAGALYSILTSDKKGAVLSSDVALKHGSAVALVGNSVYVFVPGEGVYAYSLTTKKFGLVSAESSNWGKITGTTGYQNFLYLLDTAKNMIWRYAPSAAGLGPATTWLKSGADLSGASSVVVDGSVWVGGNGAIDKFVQGATAVFNVSGAPQIGQIKAIYTAVGSNNLYLLTPGQVAVVGKNGQFTNQYKSDKFNDASGIVVDEAGGKAYILAGGKVYTFDLK